jgi:hypothetical protein
VWSALLIVAFVLSLVAGRVRRARKAEGRHAPGLPGGSGVLVPASGDSRPRRSRGQGLP